MDVSSGLEKIALLGLFTDQHVSLNTTIAQKKFFPTVIQLLGSKKGKRLLEWYDKLTQKSFVDALYRSKELFSYDYDRIFCLGDSTAPGLERGMITFEDLAQWDLFYEMLQEVYPNVPKNFLLGNHDLGYRYFPQQEGRISQQSVFNCLRQIGPSLEVINVGPWKILMLNSEIIRAHHSVLESDLSATKVLERLYSYQRQFIRSEISIAKPGKVIITIPSGSLRMYILRYNL